MAAYGVALALDPRSYAARMALVRTVGMLGVSALRRDQDPRPWMDRAEAELTTLLADYADDPKAQTHLASVRAERGHHALMHGRDPRADLDAAAAQLETLARKTSDATAWQNAGTVRFLMGQYEAGEGRDPLPAWEQSKAAMAEARKINSKSVKAYLYGAEGESAEAWWLLDQGRDPGDRLETARALLREALAIDSNMLENHTDSALLEVAVARRAQLAGRPEEAARALDAAAAELAQAARLSPKLSYSDSNAAAQVHWLRAMALAAERKPVDAEIAAGLDVAASYPDMLRAWRVAFEVVHAAMTLDPASRRELARKTVVDLEAVMASNRPIFGNEFRHILDEARALAR
jgi:hypothetical protein